MKPVCNLLSGARLQWSGLATRLGVSLTFMLIIVLTGIASGQCMNWALAGPPGYYAAHDLKVLDLGTGPTLFLADDGGARKWSGTTWVGAGSEGFDDTAFSVSAYDDGNGAALYAGGYFTHTGNSHQPIYHIAKLVNSTWTQVGGGLPAIPGQAVGVGAMCVFDDGTGSKLYVGGFFHSLGFSSIASWDGSIWGGVGGGTTDVPPAMPTIGSLLVFDDGSGPALYAGGRFITTGGAVTNNISRWDGLTWSGLGSGVTYQGSASGAGISGMTLFNDGSGTALYVTGLFDHAGGIAANSIAKWNGSVWSPVPGLDATPPYNGASIGVHDDGTGPALYVGVGFAGIDQALVHGLARWDGNVWSSLGGGFIGTVFAMQSFDDGHGSGPALYVGGILSLTVGGNLLAGSEGLTRWYGGCTHRIDPMCFGDGTFAPCPCSNYGGSQRGCANSGSAQGAWLSYSGNQVPDTLALHCTQEPTTSLSLFLQSQSLRPVQITFGDGILCLGGQVRRMYAKSASNGIVQAPESGDPSITLRSALLGDPIVPGAVRFYQVCYRDGAPNFCSPGTFNISNGLRVVW
jgi:hypothetical protein